VFARDPAAMPEFGTVADVSLGSGAVASTGGGQPHNNMQPFLTVTYLIAYQGMMPTP
jgi:microcystin-dependent protein